MEDFKDNIARNTKVHLDDMGETDLYEAAKRADDYTIVHRLGFVQTGRNYGTRNQNQSGKSSAPGQGGQPSQNAQSGQGQRPWVPYKNTGGSQQTNKGSVQGINTNTQSGAQPRGMFRARDENAWCTIHECRGHSTENCYGKGASTKTQQTPPKPVQAVLDTGGGNGRCQA